MPNDKREVVDDKLWCPDVVEGWKLRKIRKHNEETGTVTLYPPTTSPSKVKANAFGLDGKDIVHEMKLSETFPVDPSHLENLDDIATMSNLHVAPLLDLLRRRYQNNQIYTTSADILISLNPYKQIPGMYDLPSHDVLAKRVTDAARLRDGEMSDYERVDKEVLPPHVYTLANQTYLMLLSSGLHQSVLLSGESGAGKTEASANKIS